MPSRPAERASLYDDVLYPTSAHDYTHPDRLGVLAALFGLDAAPPAHCRLLEVGCSDGGNLLPMALEFPDARFVGIDSSARAIARAREQARELGLANVRFEELDLQTFDPPAASFDYAVAHGVYSWVPEAARTRLLGLYAHVLAPAGVGFVSYNALPGGRVPQILREFLLLTLEGVEDPAARIAEARRLLALISGPDAQATPLGAEAAALLRHPDAALFHDTLSPDNTPFLFTQFAARAAAHGLQYLAEADFAEMQISIVPEELQREVLARDVLHQEQLLDYLKLRRFRQTLLCPAAVQLRRELSLDRIERFAVSSPAELSIDAGGDGPPQASFAIPGGSRLTTDRAHVIDALARIAGSWPAAVWVADLYDADSSPGDRATLCHTLLRCFAGSLVRFHVAPPAVAARAGERPCTSAIARLQAREDAARVTNLRHARVALDGGLDRRLLALLDGTRDRAALCAALDGVDGLTGAELAAAVEATLVRFSRAALLAP